MDSENDIGLHDVQTPVRISIKNKLYMHIGRTKIEVAWIVKTLLPRGFGNRVSAIERREVEKRLSTE